MDGIPGLTIAGKKVWPVGKFFRQCGAGRFSLTAAQMNRCVEAVETAITETAPRMRKFTDAYPEYREIGKRMITAWEHGALNITPTATAKSRAGERLKQSVALSDVRKPRKVKKSRPSTEFRRLGDSALVGCVHDATQYRTLRRRR